MIAAPQRKSYAKGVQKQNTRSVGIPAPVGGIVANNPMYTDVTAENAAIWLYNLVPRELGCAVRPGSVEFATNIPDVANPLGGGDVRTIAFYNSIVAESAGGVDFLFVMTDAGIFDITAGGAGPWVAVLPWPASGGDAGWCSVVNYTNIAGDHYILVCDELNGYYTFDGTVWAQGTIASSPPGLDAEDLAHVTEWGGRLWFTERNTARAWYLDVLDLAGTAQPLDAGSRFLKGGHLVQCATWTIDDGVGLNDRLVMLSSGGDVLIWAGDPDIDADPLTLLGRWYVGAAVEGRRAVSNWGGETSILSSYGVAKLTDLISGQYEASGRDTTTANISRYFRSFMETTRDLHGWSVEFAALEGLVIVSVPTPNVSAPHIQFALNTNTGTWGMFRDLSMRCMSDTAHGFLFGTVDGRLMSLEGHADNVTLDKLSSDTITFSMLTHYNALGDAAIWKRPHFIRPSWVGGAQPSYAVEIHYDFDLKELTLSPPFTDAGNSLWDEALWDTTGKWEGLAQNYHETIGVNGMGRHLAVALRGESASDLSLIGFDMMGDFGGML